MPTLQLKVSPPVSATVRAALARELTALTARLLGKRPEVTAVMIEALPPAQWHVGAMEIQLATAWLEISITAGTNRQEQKAAYIEEAFALLQRLLGGGEPLEPASYVIVRELPAEDWGYGGHTQAARQRARQTGGVIASGEVVE